MTYFLIYHNISLQTILAKMCVNFGIVLQSFIVKAKKIKIFKELLILT